VEGGFLSRVGQFFLFFFILRIIGGGDVGQRRNFRGGGVGRVIFE